ncbi:MAG: CoA pyrophosphatase [Bacteroidetes bacterium]|nr:CoA pyrophosphatase [Bacteroidota bacterium]MBI3483175.1 CoA pyrophosphatase [Bacteroidota bacterium]
MKLSDLADRLTERLKLPLPGSIAHEPLRATPIGELRPKFDHKVPAKPGSVLILLYEDNGQIKFPLTKRPDYNGTHAGQVSLPGGKAEPGEDFIQTALRETEEEIGVSKSVVKVIGRLSNFFVIPSNYMITPVVAYAGSKPDFIRQESEVVKILEGNLNSLLSSDAIQVKEIIAAKTYRLMAPHFFIENEIVWGATAMMLNELRVVLRELIATNPLA